MSVAAAVTIAVIGAAPAWAERPTASPHQPSTVAAAPAAGLPPTCFGNEIKHSSARRIAESTVYIAQVDRNGSFRDSGTGVVIRGSGTPDDPMNRILTAHHVAVVGGASMLVVIASDGTLLGRAELAATADLHLTPMPGLARGDYSVLRMMAGNAPDRLRRYKAIAGLELASDPGDAFLTGVIASPAGPHGGSSGSPVLDGQGRVLGLVTSVVTDEALRPATRGEVSDPRITTEIRAVNIEQAFMSKGALEPTTGHLPKLSRAFVETIADAAVLKALGAAGNPRVAGAVRPPSSASAPPTFQVTIPGYPHALCVSFKGTLTALDFADPRQRTVEAAPPGARSPALPDTAPR